MFGRTTLIVVVAALIAACSTDTPSSTRDVDREPASAETAVTPSAPTDTAEAADASGEVGTTTVVTADGSPVEAAFSTVLDDVIIPPGFNPAGAPVDVVVSAGVIVEPVRLSIPGTAPPDGALPMVLHRNGADGWESIPADYIDGAYNVEAMSFSWHWPGWVDGAADWVGTTTVNAAGSAFNWVTGRTRPPDPCGTDPYPWVVGTDGPSDGAFHICYDQNPTDDGTERVEVKLKSNRAFSMWVIVPRGGADYVWVEGSSWDLLGPVFTAVTGADASAVLLGPGRTLTVGYRQPPVGIEHQFFAYQDVVTQMSSLLSRHVGEANAELATLLALVLCVDGGVASIVDMSWDRAASCVDLLFDAAEAQVKGAFARAVDSGRVALSEADRVGFEAAVLNSERLSGTLARLNKVKSAIALAKFTADVVILANDAGVGNALNAGRVTVVLLGTAPPSLAVTADQVRGLDDRVYEFAYQHPTLGSLTIRFDGGFGVEHTPKITATNPNGDVVFVTEYGSVFRESSDLVGMTSFARVPGPVDELGHIFWYWNPGRLLGTSVLVPTADGFDDVGTSPDLETFYSSEVVDLDGDGRFEIELARNDCEPSCAEGTDEVSVWAWDGAGFVIVDEYLSPRG